MNPNEPETALVPCTAGPLAPAFQSGAMTPQQARVDAVATLTGVALAKAATLQLTTEETKSLTADFADSDFRTGAGGKEALLYIEHAALRDRLNTVLGLGQWAIIVRETWNEDFQTGKGTAGVRVYSRAMLIVRGCYVGEAVGDMDYWPSSGQQNYGDAFEGSKTAAFRRCAKEFGVGLQAWRKDWCEGWWQRKRTGHPNAPQTPPKPTPTPTPRPETRPATPEERKVMLLAKLKGMENEATAVFIEEGLTMENEIYEEISLLTIERMTPNQMLALIKTVRQRKTDNDQVPGAEVQEHPTDAVAGVVEDTKVIEGKTKAGKAWTKYSVCIDKVWHSTFSKTDYETASALKGQQVLYTAKVGQYGSDLLTIESAGENIP